MLATRDSANRPIPDIIRQGPKELVQPVGPCGDVESELIGVARRTGLDLDVSTSRATHVLLDDFSPNSALDASTHCLGVTSKVGQDVSDSPTSKARRSTDVDIREPRNNSAQSVVRVPASIDICVEHRDLHAPRLRADECSDGQRPNRRGRRTGDASRR